MTVVVDKIVSWLSESKVDFRRIDHEPTLTSAESARVRNEPLEVGAKALLLKSKEGYLITVLPAHLRLNSAAVKDFLGTKSLRFATSDELLELTGLIPGSLPPFGRPIFPLPLYSDPQVGAHHGRIAFNAGSRTSSIIMKQSDWLELAQPTLFQLSDNE